MSSKISWHLDSSTKNAACVRSAGPRQFAGFLYEKLLKATPHRDPVSHSKLAPWFVNHMLLASIRRTKGSLLASCMKRFLKELCWLPQIHGCPPAETDAWSPNIFKYVEERSLLRRRLILAPKCGSSPLFCRSFAYDPCRYAPGRAEASICHPNRIFDLIQTYLRISSKSYLEVIPHADVIQIALFDCNPKYFRSDCAGSSRNATQSPEI